MILMDTIIVRYVRVKYNGIKDTEYYALMLGEVKITSSKIKHEHIHEHDDDIEISINWYKDVIDYLKITNEEIIEYNDLINKNVKRILEARKYSVKIPYTIFLIILKGWSVKRYSSNIISIVGALIDNKNIYLIYIEDNIMENQQITYMFKIAELKVEKPI